MDESFHHITVASGKCGSLPPALASMATAFKKEEEIDSEAV